MSNGVARMLVLPREMASRITVFAVVRGGWAIAASVLFFTIPELIEYIGLDAQRDDLIVPTGSLILMLAMLGLVFARPRWWSLLAYLVIGALAIYEFQTSLLTTNPDLSQQGVYLLNRPAVALVLVGASTRRARDAILWTTGGFVVAMVVTVSSFARFDLMFKWGLSPSIAFANTVALYAALAFIFYAQRGRRPDLERLRTETRQLEAERVAQQRTAALLHDTVLSDLAIVINGPDRLDARARERIRTDVAALSLHEQELLAPATPDDPALEARDRLMQLVSDFRWRGLTVELTGDTGAVLALSFEAAVATLGAVRACLENVLKHAGTTVAEVIIEGSDDDVTIMIVDSGAGFDPDEIGEDRLGVRSSIIQRVEAVGGYARIWSAVGSGTSVLISVPTLSPAFEGDGHAHRP